ncbi:MAG: hypothetical protein IJW49_00095 [Clostridia bacterium]|nr:hypothetical protein [Clostridia bacterium]
MKIYSLYSKSLKRYNLPFFAEDDAESVSVVSKMVAAQNDPSLICALDDLCLMCIGEVNLTDEDPIIGHTSWLVMDDLHQNLPLPPMIKECIDKYYRGNANA